MRYYRIEITPANSAAGAQPTVFTTLDGKGNYDPGSLQIELDMSVYQQASDNGNGWLQIKGQPLSYIAQATDLNGADIKVFGGMSKGFPLADPSQQGLLIQGTVFQAFGNWVNLEQTVDFIITPNPGFISAPVNLTLNWTDGQDMKTAITNAMQTAFPDYSLQVNISDKLSLPATAMGMETGFFQTCKQFAQYCFNTSRSLIPQDYNGVQFTFLGNKIIYVFDGLGTGKSPGGTTADQPKMIKFTDMIGQPTWIGPQQVQVHFVLRGDLNVGDFIQFPPAVQTFTQQAQVVLGSSKPSFSGAFMIVQMRHVGNYRQADAYSWVTIVNAIPASASNEPTYDLGDTDVIQ